MELQIGKDTYRLTAHAKHRMKKRGVSIDDLVEALQNIKRVRKQVKEDSEERILITGRNKVSCVVTDTNVIVTVYNYKKEYYASKNKHAFNKKRRTLKKEFGNRLRRT